MYKLQTHHKIVSVWIAMPRQTISGDIMLELVLHHDAVLRLYQLPAHVTRPLRWVCKQMILPDGVQVIDSHDCRHEA